MADYNIEIREAIQDDFDFVVNLMVEALTPYYGGDHVAHAKRIFDTHIAGSVDMVGHFSFEQKMFILLLNSDQAGMIHVVGKRQGNYKISPIIVAEKYKKLGGLGSKLLEYAESYAKGKQARQMYCTVALENTQAVHFFKKNNYINAGKSESHYKIGITEMMFYKVFLSKDDLDNFDRPHISILPCEEKYEKQVREILLKYLSKTFSGIDDLWLNALFDGYKRKDSFDINKKYKLIFVAVDRAETVLGVVAATPKKGEPIKLMPCLSLDLPAFVALITDIPYELKLFGHKLYMHISPSVEETIALQQRGWQLDAALPAAYHDDVVTQQWSLDIEGENIMRMMRVKKVFLDAIGLGQKTLEVRVGYAGIKKITKGEKIIMASQNDSQIVEVLDKRSYENFEMLLEHEDYRKIAPHINSKKEVFELLNNIYPPHKVMLGIIVLEIKAIN
jgi:ASC-1-like (ASCH) protein/ribosomal protein S18 acetylase RimI-like enzyme